MKKIEPGYCFESYLDKNGDYYLITDPNSRIWLKIRKDIIRYLPNKNQSCEIHHFDFETGIAIFLSASTLAVIEQKTAKLYLYDLQTRVIKPFKVANQELRFSGIVHNLLLDKNGILWVASNEGIYKVDITNKRSTHYQLDNDFEDNRVLIITEDRQGRLWLGRFMEGL